MITEQHIIDAIKFAKNKINVDLRKNVVWAVYNALKSFYLDDKQYVLLNAPTGSGKSMIGLLVSISVTYLSKYNVNASDDSQTGRSYYLTSTKSLQEQMDTDIDRFKIGDFANVLKGTGSYDCTYGNWIMSNGGRLAGFERQTYKDACEAAIKYCLKNLT